LNPVVQAAMGVQTVFGWKSCVSSQCSDKEKREVLVTIFDTLSDYADLSSNFSAEGIALAAQAMGGEVNAWETVLAAALLAAGRKTVRPPFWPAGPIDSARGAVSTVMGVLESASNASWRMNPCSSVGSQPLPSCDNMVVGSRASFFKSSKIMDHQFCQPQTNQSCADYCSGYNSSVVASRRCLTADFGCETRTNGVAAYMSLSLPMVSPNGMSSRERCDENTYNVLNKTLRQSTWNESDLNTLYQTTTRMCLCSGGLTTTRINGADAINAARVLEEASVVLSFALQTRPFAGVVPAVYENVSASNSDSVADAIRTSAQVLGIRLSASEAQLAAFHASSRSGLSDTEEAHSIAKAGLLFGASKESAVASVVPALLLLTAQEPETFENTTQILEHSIFFCRDASGQASKNAACALQWSAP
jgi:hypothetical protein